MAVSPIGETTAVSQDIWQPKETPCDALPTLHAQVQDETSDVTQRLSALAQEIFR